MAFSFITFFYILYAFFIYHILSCSLGSIFYNCIYGYIFCIHLLNILNYVFLF
jgi:hypothetical protein